jgi:hypothetical protein
MINEKTVYPFQTKYSKYNVVLSFNKYRNGRTQIELLDVDEPGSCVMIATVNMDNVSLEEGEIIIKDYSENEGVLDFLIQNGITTRPKRWISSGWVTCPVVDLLVKPY